MVVLRWLVGCSCVAVLAGGCSLLYPFDLPEDGGDDGETSEDVEVLDDGDAAEYEVPETCGNGGVDPPDEECDGDPARACATTCDPTNTTGTQACVGCRWEACVPPLEDCNGVDDDCDTQTDEGYPCAMGTTQPCTTPCGLDGTGLCDALCALPTRATCASATEACNGCDDNRDTFTDEGCGCQTKWVTEHPLAPGPEALQGMIATPDGHAFVAGSDGVVLHYDGTRWSRMTTPGSYTWRWVNALSANFAVAVGSVGSVMWWNGSVWTFDPDSGTTWTLFDVRILAENDVWAVGANGTAIHWDGTGWTTSPTGTTRHFYRLAAVAPDDLFAVGTGGTVMHHDGTSWTRISPAWLTTEVETVWVPEGAARVYIAGTDGVTAVWERATGIWTPLTTGTVETIYSIWGSSESDIWGVGGYNGGIVLHYDGSTWAQDVTVPSLDPHGFLSVTGTAADNVFASMRDGGILHFDGTRWLPMEGCVTASLRSVWGTSGQNVYAVGATGSPNGESQTVVLRYDGSRWLFTEADWLSRVDGQELWASSPADLFLTGTDERIRQFDGTSWTTTPVGFPGNQFVAVWGAPSAEVFVVGGQENAGGLPLALHRTGTPPSWQPLPLSPALPDVDLFDVSGTTADDVTAVGTAGAIMRRTGGDTLVQDASGTTDDLRGVWVASATEAFAVGDNGTILHWDGSAWAQMTSPTDPWYGYRLNGVWGSSPTNVFAVGSSGMLLRHDGTAWTEVPIDTAATLTDVWGTSANNVFVVANDRSGKILHRCGPAW